MLFYFVNEQDAVIRRKIKLPSPASIHTDKQPDRQPQGNFFKTMGTNCAPLVADLFLFCYERDFMLSLSEDNQSGVIEAFNSTSRYLDDLLNIDNNFFDSMVNRICPSELQLNKANVSERPHFWIYIYLYRMVL